MPLKEGPVGPFPDGADIEEYDRLRRRVLWTMPSGLYILGSRGGGPAQRHDVQLGATQVGFDPKLLAVSVEQEAFTHELIEAGRWFSLNIVDREDRPSSASSPSPSRSIRMPRRSTGSRSTTAARARRSSTRLWRTSSARSARTSDVGTHTLVLGEVVDAGFQKAEDTPPLRMEGHPHEPTAAEQRGSSASDRLPTLASAADELEAARQAAEALGIALLTHPRCVDGSAAARAGMGLVGHGPSVV